MRPTVEGTFLDGSGGALAIVTWTPPADVDPRFRVLFVPPFAEEMNKSRRMVAIQARAFAAAGGIVSVVDLRGTGDSGGDHGEATWDGWRDDVARAFHWLAERSSGPVLLWGLRLGALLAVDMVDKQRIAPGALVLWQPVASGRAFFNQFLRVASMRQQMDGDTEASPAPKPREALASGMPVEVAGYGLHPRLVGDADAIDLADLDPRKCPVIVREVSIDPAQAASPAARRAAERWRTCGADVDVAAVSGPSFWAALEIEEAPELVAATTSAVLSRVHEVSQVEP